MPKRGYIKGLEGILVAKGKYKKWLEKENLILLEGWARDGLIDEEISKKIGIATGTLYEWKKKYPEINESMKKGKEVVDFAVEKALLKIALNGELNAIKFWLRNRNPDKWRENQADTAKNSEVNIIDDINYKT
ncbi:MAG: helix-turn-helix domain-containing protein [Eubacterium sp.]